MLRVKNGNLEREIDLLRKKKTDLENGLSEITKDLQRVSEQNADLKKAWETLKAKGQF